MSSTAMDGSRATILVIEDDNCICELIRNALDCKNYRVVCVHNGQEGLRQLETEHPNMIILDLGLPVMSGTEFINAYHQQFTSPVPIVATSAYAIDPQTLAHVDSFMRKPFSLNTLLQTVANTLGE